MNPIPIPRFLIVALLIAASGCSGENDIRAKELPVYCDASLTPFWGRAANKAGRHRIADWSFTDQVENTISAEELDGRICVVSFIFTTCPILCPRIVESLMPVQERYATDPAVVMISHSVLPEHDTVEVLRRYAEKKGIMSGKWHLLTGDRALVYRVARESYFADALATGSSDFVHTEKVFLVDQERRIRGVYNGTHPSDVDRLIMDIATLKRVDVRFTPRSRTRNPVS